MNNVYVDVVSLVDYNDSNVHRVLTKGKTYRSTCSVVDNDDSILVIDDDMCKSRWFDVSFFKNVKDHRNDVLKDLLEC
jgi:hypothetical protein